MQPRGVAWSTGPLSIWRLRALSYVTPLDPQAVARGWQYRLRRIGDVVDKERLAVVVNGTLFGPDSGWWPRMVGDLANGRETVVADHVVSHLWEHTYLLWFDEQLTPHLRPSKPPTTAELVGQNGRSADGRWLHDRKVSQGSGRAPDSRTAVAIDQQRKLLFLAVGQNISPHLILQELADLGAKDQKCFLDGRGTSSMAVGKGAAGTSAGVLSRWLAAGRDLFGSPQGSAHRSETKIKDYFDRLAPGDRLFIRPNTEPALGDGSAPWKGSRRSTGVVGSARTAAVRCPITYALVNVSRDDRLAKQVARAHSYGPNRRTAVKKTRWRPKSQLPNDRA